MITITDLPVDVIYTILQQKTIDIEDVLNFSSTCKRFHGVIDNNLLWQTKFYQRWPYLKKIYDRRIQNGESINFKDEVKASVNCRKELFSYLSLLSEKVFNIYEPSNNDVENFDILFRPNMGAHIMNYHFLKDELIYQIKMPSLSPKYNLTHKYYSNILLPFLEQRHLGDVWQEFINYPKEQQLLENAATIVAQWYQPQKCIFYFDIEALLDDIAQQALSSLKKAHRDHPIFSTSDEQLSFWKYNNIDDNQWSKKEEKQIIDILRTVLFNELGFHFHGSPGSFSGRFKPKSAVILIDCVLESKIGNSISLAVVFQSVARRLGVRCDLVSFRTHYSLSWKPKSIAKKPEDEECFYIDFLHDGIIRDRNDCPTRDRRPIESYNKHEISPTEMVLRMINQLQKTSPYNPDWKLQERSLAEFQYMIEPDNINTIESLLISRRYFDKKTNISDILVTLQRKLSNYSDRMSVEARQTEDLLRRCEMYVHDMNCQISGNHIIPKDRTRNIKYAVGMIVSCHIKYSAKKTGVIIGWDEKFNSHAKTRLEFNIEFSHPYIHGNVAMQPFYFILSERGNIYYAPQDSLEASSSWIEHSEIGRYFCRFADFHYVPNEILTKHYPHDQAILNRPLILSTLTGPPPQAFVLEFPTDSEKCKKWIDAMNLGEFRPTKKSVLCSLHFQGEFLIRKKNSRRVILKFAAIPSVLIKASKRALDIEESDTLDLEFNLKSEKRCTINVNLTEGLNEHDHGNTNISDNIEQQFINCATSTDLRILEEKNTKVLSHLDYDTPRIMQIRKEANKRIEKYKRKLKILQQKERRQTKNYKSTRSIKMKN